MTAASAKLVLLISLVAAGALNLWLAAREWPALPFLTLGIVLLTYVLARRWSGAVTFTLAVATSVAPAAFAFCRGRFLLSDLTLWLAAVVTLVVATSRPLRWHLPGRWIWPLAVWALVAGVSWPVVVAREAELSMTLLYEGGIPSSGGGGTPADTVLWITHVVLVLGAGLLWFDWLFGRYPAGREAPFAREVLAGFGAGWVVAGLVAVYQVSVDFEFLNMGHWAYQRRAAGTLMDANPYGLVAAVSGPAIAAAMWPPTVPRRAIAVTAALGLSWFGLWASGSRSALLAGAVATVALGYQLWRVRPALLRARRGVAMAVLCGVILSAGALATSAERVDTPLARLVRLGPADRADVGGWLRYLWARESYGTVAIQMVRDSPLVGIGVGSYHMLAPDYAQALTGTRLPPDNAQNWARHQLAELGVLGGLGPIVFAGFLAWLVVTARAAPGREPQAGILRGTLIAFGLVSLVGVPTLNTSVVFMFWLLAFWYTRQIDPGALAGRAPGRAAWMAGFVLVVVYTAGLAAVSVAELRVPHRAVLGEWDLEYGFYEPESSAAYGEYRWTQRTSVSVLPAGTQRIGLTLWVHHPDASDRPVRLQVWRDAELVVDVMRSDATPVVTDVTIPDDARRFMLSTAVDRTWRPADTGAEDSRELGMAVAWRHLPSSGR